MLSLIHIYLVLGGYIASSRTDFIQGIIMIGGVILMVVCLVLNPNVGGFANAFEKLSEVDGGKLISIFGKDNWSFLLTNILLTSFGVWGLSLIHI